MSKKIIFTSLLLFCGVIIFTGASCQQQAYDGGIYKSWDQGENWEQRNFLGIEKNKVVSISNKNVHGLWFDPIDPNIVYASTLSSGIYKTWDRGDNWETFSFNNGFYRDLAIDPLEPKNMYTAVNNNIKRTADGGVAWETVYTDTKNGRIKKILIDHYNPQNIYAFTSISTIIKSEDYGVNWEIVHQFEEPVLDVLMDPIDSRVMYYLDITGRLYKTYDAGQTWATLNQEKEFKEIHPKAGSMRFISMDANNSQTLYTSSLQGLLKSTDGGDNWEQINTLIPNENKENESIKNIVVAPQNSEIIYFTIDRLIHKTTDGGETWKVVENFPSQRNILTMEAVPDDLYTLYIGTELIVEEDSGLF